MSFESRPRRILVVDDEAAVRELIVLRLELSGYQAVAARDGQEAIKRITETRPDAMILDINMPRLDGFGVLRRLAQMRGIPPTMVLTARNAADDVKTAVALGARDFLSKPFKDEQLLARVARLLRPRRPTSDCAAPGRLQADPPVEI